MPTQQEQLILLSGLSRGTGMQTGLAITGSMRKRGCALLQNLLRLRLDFNNLVQSWLHATCFIEPNDNETASLFQCCLQERRYQQVCLFQVCHQQDLPALLCHLPGTTLTETKRPARIVFNLRTLAQLGTC